jgi:hypothetical protein
MPPIRHAEQIDRNWLPGFMNCGPPERALPLRDFMPAESAATADVRHTTRRRLWMRTSTLHYHRPNLRQGTRPSNGTLITFPTG